MTVREQFPLGCRVRPSAELLVMRKMHGKRGTVIGYSRDGTCIRIWLDGQQRVSACTYGASRWRRTDEPIVESEAKRGAPPWCSKGGKAELRINRDDVPAAASPRDGERRGEVFWWRGKWRSAW